MHITLCGFLHAPSADAVLDPLDEDRTYEIELQREIELRCGATPSFESIVFWQRKFI